MSETTDKVMRIGNISFSYPFARMDGGEVEVTIDPTLVIEHLRSNLPELFLQSNETPDAIKDLLKDQPEALEMLQGVPNASDWQVIQTIMARTAAGLPFPQCGIPIRTFRDNLADAVGAPKDAMYSEIFACMMACFVKIGEAEQLKKNSLKQQSSSQPTPESPLDLKTSTMGQFKVCGSTSNPLEQERTSAA